MGHQEGTPGDAQRDLSPHQLLGLSGTRGLADALGVLGGSDLKKVGKLAQVNRIAAVAPE